MKIIEETIWVPSTHHDGFKICVKTKRRSDCKQPPLLMLHGTMFSSDLIFNITVGGYSASDLMAMAGMNCYMVTAIGYADSSIPDCIKSDEPTEESCNTYQDWINDVSDVVEYLNLQKFGLFCFSAGALPSMHLAVKYADRVNKLVIWGLRTHESKPQTEPMPPNVSFKYLDLDFLIMRRYCDIPVERREEIFPAAWCEELKEQLNRHMPIKMPNGTSHDRYLMMYGLVDISEYVRFSNIKCDTLFINGLWDTIVDMDYFYKVFKQIGAKNKKFRLIKDSSHTVITETTRQKFIDVMNKFLEE